MFRRHLVWGVIATFALLSTFTNAKSANAQLPPSTQPLVISQPGVYVLNRDIRVASGDAVTVTTGNVTLDLNGRSVSTGTPGTGNGVRVNSAGGALSGITVKNGKIGSFAVDVMVENAVNLRLEDLQIVGADLSPTSGPGEIGILLISVRGSSVARNLITNVGLGIFVRGPLSGGNRIFDNTLVGGVNTPRPLGMCWNPLPGAASNAPGPKGDLVYNNHISQFQTGISFSTGSIGNVVRENTIAFVTAPFSAATSDVTNVLTDNVTIQVAP